MPMQVDLVSPERILYSGEADMVVCRTIGGGEVAFLAGHAPFLAALDISTVRIKTTDGDYKVAAVHGGFVHVQEDKVIVLSDVAEMADQIDVDRARKAKEAAEQRRGRGEEDEDTEAEEAVRRATVRLDAAERG
jgi:F-type H+-transporting ATPase subunit epsilon